MIAEEVTKLLSAARNGDLTVLDSERVTDFLDDQGANCIHYAARGGSLAALQLLVDTKGLDPTKRNNVGATPLHDAAATGNVDALKWLLNRPGTKVDDQDGSGATVTHLSARYGHTQTLTWLLDATNCDILKKSASGALPVHFAAESGHLECVKLLVEEAPRSVNMQMNNGATPVYLACQLGHLNVAQYLSQKNGTPKIHTFDGMSPLHAAAQMNQLHIVKWLIKDQGLNPNERDFDGATPLHYAASQGHKDIVEWLMKEGGARIILDNLGGSPLHSAAELGQNQIVFTLLKNGCDPEITDNEGLTAEELAEKCGNTVAVAILRGEITSLPASPSASCPAVSLPAPVASVHVQQTPAPAPVLPPPPPVAPGPSSLQKSLEQSRQRKADRGATSHSQTAGEIIQLSEQSLQVAADINGKDSEPNQVHICNSRETGEREYVHVSECSSQNCSQTGVVKSIPHGPSLSSDVSGPARRSEASSKVWQAAAHGTASMATRTDEESNGGSSEGESQEPAKSVIKISSNNVTIISTGGGSKRTSKIVTTPLRKNSDEYLDSGAMVTARKRDSEFISALNQKFQVNGSSNKSSPDVSPGSTLKRMPSYPATSPATTAPAWQHHQKHIETALMKRQQAPEEKAETLPPPAPLVNGYRDFHEPAVNGGGSDKVLPPPPPPPPPLGDPSSSGKKVIADASYSSSKPKSVHSYSSVPNGSPKHDLMAAIHAVVASGAPSAGLRKTRGPLTGGVSEVFASKKGSFRAATPSSMGAKAVTGSGPEKQDTSQDPREEFDPKNFLDQVPKVDSSGHVIPDWKRHMMAKTAAQKAEEEYLEKKKVEEYEARFKNMPVWKRALIEKKEGSSQ